MPVTLAEYSKGTLPALDVRVIDEFRKANPFLNNLEFDPVVNPAGGGMTMTYSYTRLVDQATASFRAINSDYTPSEVTKAVYSAGLGVLGGAYQIDRVIATNEGSLASENALQMSQKIKAAGTYFNDQVINGDTAVNAAGFDGLNKALTGSSTEFGLTTVTDWSDWDTDEKAVARGLDQIDEFLSSLDGEASMVVGNRRLIARVRAAARRAGAYVKNPIEGLQGVNGSVFEEQYGNIRFFDAGEKAGSSAPVIPIATRTVGGQSVTGLTDLYAVRLGMDGFHGIATTGRNIVWTKLPDFNRVEAVQTGAVELGPIGVALKATKAAAVLRNIKVA